MNIKKIGVLTSGGDAPGMNAVIYSVVKCAKKNNIDVVGIYRGYNGLISGDVRPLQVDDVVDIMKKGGTILYSARCKDFEKIDGVKLAVKTCKDNNIDGLVIVGGDGTFKGASNIVKQGVSCACIPGTIDNDISCTDYTIGYDSAVNTAVEMVDKLCDTTASHDRCSVVEVMGRSSGYIALGVGISCGANYIVIPEYEFNKQDLFNNITAAINGGRKHFVVVVAEGILNVSNLAKEIENELGVESRATVLGHVQRGGSPTVKDRVLGVNFGVRAVEILLSGNCGRVIGLKDDALVDYDILQGLSIKKEFPKALYEMARSLY